MRVHEERAQGVVEFAFIATVLMLLFLGTVDFARFLYYDLSIQSATRVGAETASNHCPSKADCYLSAATPDDYVLQAAYCEANPYLTLNMVNPITTCSPCGPSLTCTDPCGSTGGCQACPTSGQDVCLTRDTTTTTSGCSSSHACVTVSIGYHFQPISFYLSWLFSAQPCWTGDSTSNGHTLCASAMGRVS